MTIKRLFHRLCLRVNTPNEQTSNDQRQQLMALDRELTLMISLFKLKGERARAHTYNPMLPAN